MNGSLYLDVTGAGYSSMDLQNALSISELLTKYYPNTFSKVYMYGVPTFIKPFLNIVLGLLPEKYRKRVQVIIGDPFRSVLTFISLDHRQISRFGAHTGFAGANAGWLLNAGRSRQKARHFTEGDPKRDQAARVDQRTMFETRRELGHNRD